MLFQYKHSIHKLKCVIGTLSRTAFTVFTLCDIKLVYISCIYMYVKPMNCMVLNNKQFNIVI